MRNYCCVTEPGLLLVPMAQSIAENIEYFRAQLGISKGELARRLGYRTVGMIVHWTNGTRVPSQESVARLAAALNCTGQELDPEEAASPLARRQRRRTDIQKRHSHSDSSSGTRTEGLGELMAGELPTLPDADQFRKVLGVWLQLDTAEERAAFVAHAQSFLGIPSRETRPSKKGPRR